MTESESDDSDTESGLGNVNRVVMRPPGHSGKAKKGHLCFDASFETGNLGKVDLINDIEYDLYIRHDTCNPYHRMWFHFTVDNTKLDQRVFLNILNISKSHNVFATGMAPIVRSTSKKKWCRLPPYQVYFYHSPLHNNHLVLTLAFCFDKEEETYQFAFSYPYSYSRCQMYLELIEKKMLPHFKRDVIGYSLQKRRIDVITITDPKNIEVNAKLRMVVIFSRIHPGDSPTSYICQGIIDFLISNNSVAEKLRDRVIFKIVPMINPDGVVLGNFRSNLLGSDFNRWWNNISKWSHPPLFALFNMISELNKKKNIEWDLFIDLHADCTLSGVFVQGNTYDNIYRFERHKLFPKLLSQNVEGYESNYCMFNRDNRKKGSCRRFISNVNDSVNCYTVSVSFYGYTDKKTKKMQYFTEQSYQCLGYNMVRTFADYYSCIGVLPKQPKKVNTDDPYRKRKFSKRFAFSRTKRRKHVKQKHSQQNKTKSILQVIRNKTQQPRTNLLRKPIDFSDVKFPPITNRKTVFLKRKLLLNKSNQSFQDLQKKIIQAESSMKILSIK